MARGLLLLLKLLSSISAAAGAVENKEMEDDYNDPRKCVVLKEVA